MGTPNLTCSDCHFRKFYAKQYDAHFDWRDCPLKCEYANEQEKEEAERSEFSTNIISVFDPILITWNKTNADRIRAMTDEELADFITEQRFCTVCAIADKFGIDVSSTFLIGRKNTLNWLKQETGRSEE